MLKSKKPVYYYDPETCTFHKAEFSMTNLLRKIGLYSLAAVAATLVVFLIFDKTIAQKKVDSLTKKQEELAGMLESANETLDYYESNLEKLLNRENRLYAPITDLDPISRTKWNGGRGGISRYDVTDKNVVISSNLKLEQLNFRIKVLKDKLEKIRVKADEKSESLQNLPSLVPVTGTLISGFGFRVHPVRGDKSFHDGIDFACPSGTPIYASGNGKVIKAEFNANGYGNVIDLDHENGYQTRYAHLSRLKVKPGQWVKRGEVIGYSGNTGLSTGPHLHYEVHHHQQKIDPIDFYYTDVLPADYLNMKLEGPAMD